MAIIKEFKQFAMRGNVIDLAVGVIIGGAFGKITTSLVNDVIMPPVGLLLGKVDFSNLYVSLSGVTYDSLQAAKDAGAATLNYGAFFNTIIDFLIVAFVVFLLVKHINKLHRAPEPTPSTKPCPFCFSQINIAATRCSQCTSELTK